MSDIFLDEPVKTPSNEEPSPFVAFFKGMGYFLLFFACNTLVTLIFLFYFAFQKGLEYQVQNIPLNMESIMEYAQDQIYVHSNLFIISYTISFIVILALIFAFRRKNFFKETQIRKISLGYLPSIIVISVGLMLFVNSVLNFLPRAWLANYMESSSFISSGTLLGSVLSQVIFAPFTEELAFRGMMLSRFNKAIPRWIGIALSSFCFGLLHGELIWIIYAALLGIVLSVIANYTGSIVSSILIHTLFNAFGTILSYLNVGITLTVYGVMAPLGLILLIAGFIMLFKQPKALPLGLAQ